VQAFAVTHRSPVGGRFDLLANLDTAGRRLLFLSQGRWPGETVLGFASRRSAQFEENVFAALDQANFRLAPLHRPFKGTPSDLDAPDRCLTCCGSEMESR